ncbi:MAG: hypothetical protein E3J87_10710, partial [Candidatus Cloacimonadota bacterium]
MMIKRLLFVQRIGLKLLILSLFTFPVILSSEDKDEGLELPEVIIYGTYLGKMQFSPKKDFYPYISQGNLFPLSRLFSPEIRFPSHKKRTGGAEIITSHWLLLDAGAGNWWADKVFLDCGLRNKMGLLSLRFTDFRRKGWAEDHSVNKDFFKIKGVLNKENSYVSGNIFYNYDNLLKENISTYDTFTTHQGGVKLLAKPDLQVDLLISGQYSMNVFLDRYFGMPIVIPRTVEENLYSYSVSYRNTFDFADINARVLGEGASKSAERSGEKSSSTNTMIDIILQKNFNGKIVLAPGIRVFLAEDAFKADPLVSIKTVFPGLDLYPYIMYMKDQKINTLISIYQRYPLVNNINYSICEKEKIEGGVEGRWQKVLFRIAYSHIKYEDFPLRYDHNQGYVPTLSCESDMIETGVDAVIEKFILELKGSYSPREKLLYEPVSEFDAEISYKGIPRVVPFTSLNSAFSIETHTDTVDVFSLNGGVEYQILKNLALRFEVDNIMDQRYEIWQGYTEGGVQFYASIKYKV